MHMCCVFYCLSVAFCLPFLILSPFLCNNSKTNCWCAPCVLTDLMTTCFSHLLQGILSTAVRPPTNARSPKGDASRARPAASWNVLKLACWKKVSTDFYYPLSFICYFLLLVSIQFVQYLIRRWTEMWCSNYFCKIYKIYIPWKKNIYW